MYCKRLKPVELTPLLGSLEGYLDHVPKVAYSLYGDPAKAAQLYSGVPQPQQATQPPPPQAAPLVLPPPPGSPPAGPVPPAAPGGTFQP